MKDFNNVWNKYTTKSITKGLLNGIFLVKGLSLHVMKLFIIYVNFETCIPKTI